MCVNDRHVTTHHRAPRPVTINQIDDSVRENCSSKSPPSKLGGGELFRSALNRSMLEIPRTPRRPKESARRRRGWHTAFGPVRRQGLSSASRRCPPFFSSQPYYTYTHNSPNPTRDLPVHQPSPQREATPPPRPPPAPAPSAWGRPWRPSARWGTPCSRAHCVGWVSTCVK